MQNENKYAVQGSLETAEWRGNEETMFSSLAYCRDLREWVGSPLLNASGCDDPVPSIILFPEGNKNVDPFEQVQVFRNKKSRQAGTQGVVESFGFTYTPL